MNLLKGRAMMCTRSTVIQSRMRMSLIPGRIRETCLLAGTDFMMKKS